MDNKKRLILECGAAAAKARATATGSLTSIVTTHQHWDHHRALPAVVEDVVRGALDLDVIEI